MCVLAADPAVLFAAGETNGTSASVQTQTAGGTKIHFISLHSTTDAILLESNGHFGLVDSGEDWDYPDGTNYTLRPGVTQGIGYEEQVIYYLEQLGVEKLDFYIATHSHSDHIGSGDEILRRFPTERLYIQEYKDEYLNAGHTDPDDPYYTGDGDAKLWDNQYVFDTLIAAAQETGTQIIMNLDSEENTANRSFTMGDMTIDIMNYERDRDENGNIIPVYEENCNSLVVLVTAYGHTALLTSDLDPWTGGKDGLSDTVKIVNQLSEKLGGTVDEQAKSRAAARQIPENYTVQNYDVWNGVTLSQPDTRVNDPSGGPDEENPDALDESKPNDETTFSIDLLKMSHHAIDYNNTTWFLTSVNPETVVVTGYESFYNERMRACMPGADTFFTTTDSAAIVADFTAEGIQTQYVKTESGWLSYNDTQYYMDDNGRIATGYWVIDGEEYCFTQRGTAQTEDGWVTDQDGKYHYWYGDGHSAKSEWIEEADGTKKYCDENGFMTTGWKQIDSDWYYFDKNGVMAADTWIGDYYVDESGKWLESYRKPHWEFRGSNWYYLNADGSCVKNQWMTIDGKLYYFNSSGHMARNWNKFGTSWYYMGSDGAVRTGWQWVGSDWFYMNSNGIMQTGWLLDGNTWYYLDSSSGAMKKGWQWVDTAWYYMNSSGAMQKGWLLDGKTWYYLDSSSGAMKTGWVLDGSTWYYMNSSGVMQTGWQWVGNAWYYMNSSGAMQTGWRWIGNAWYYLNSSGAMQKGWLLDGSTWYYLNSSGAMQKGWRWVGNAWYYLNSSGAMLTGWQRIGNTWYYMDSSGAMQTSQWIGDYYVQADGSMAVNKWIGGYYVGSDGKWRR